MIRLRLERHNRNLSQIGLSHVTHVAQPTISAIEIGKLKPTRAQLACLSAFFRVPEDDLLKDVTALGPSR